METVAMGPASFMHIAAATVLAPLLLGVINRTKAVMAGRKGRPLLQAYYDFFKLMRKGAVYSRTTTWVFRAGPVVGISSVLLAISLLPFGGAPAPLNFAGDFVLFAYLLGLARFFTVIAALDTGSSFEGMGASREAAFSAMSEPVLFFSLLVFARQGGSASLSGMTASMTVPGAHFSLPAMAMVASSLFLLLLAENSRIPVDDPNTHLELTMIHEVMVLDHSGPDFAYITYGAALKLWAFGALITGLLVPLAGLPVLPGMALSVAGVFVLAVVVGIVESSMARLRLVRIPQYLAAAAALAISALILVL